MNTYNTSHLSTNQLVDLLSEDMPMDTKYRNPLRYFMSWLGISMLFVLAYMSTMMSVRFDLILRLTDVEFIIGVASMFIGACFFAYSALLNAIPATNNKLYKQLGIICTVIWVQPIIVSMLTNFENFQANQVVIRYDVDIFMHICVAGCIPLVTLWYYIHRLTPLNAKRIACDVGLASFMFSAAMSRFFYAHLFNGQDDGYSLWLWTAMPFIIASAITSIALHPFFRLRIPRKYLSDHSSPVPFQASIV